MNKKNQWKLKPILRRARALVWFWGLRHARIGSLLSIIVKETFGHHYSL